MDNYEQIEYNYITLRLHLNSKLRENVSKYLLESRELELQAKSVDSITPLSLSRKRSHEDTENMPPKSLFLSDDNKSNDCIVDYRYLSMNTSNTINNYAPSDINVVVKKYCQSNSNENVRNNDDELNHYDKYSSGRVWNSRFVEKFFMIYIFNLNPSTGISIPPLDIIFFTLSLTLHPHSISRFVFTF